MTHSRSSSKVTAQAMPCRRQPDLDVAHREFDGVEYDLPTGSWIDGVDRHGAREAGGTEVGLDLDAIRLRLDGPGQAKRCATRREASWWGLASGEGYLPRSE